MVRLLLVRCKRKQAQHTRSSTSRFKSSWKAGYFSNMVAEDALSTLLAQVIKSLGVRQKARSLLRLQPFQLTKQVVAQRSNNETSCA